MDAFLNIAYLFLFYSFLGWVIEVVYHVLCQGQIVNRGFLNGPFCPIYGLGMLAVLSLLNPVLNNLPLLFFAGMFLTTFIELLGGWLLEVLFGLRWWDYSKEPFNVHGYICLKFSVAWGLAVTTVVRLIHPFVSSLGKLLLSFHTKYLIFFFLFVLLVDLVATVVSVLHLKRELKALTKAGEDIHRISDAMTAVIGKRSMKLGERAGEARVQAALGKMEAEQALDEILVESHEILTELKKEQQKKLAELKEYRASLRSFKFFGMRRIIKAFPTAEFHDFKERLHNLMEELRGEE